MYSKILSSASYRVSPTQISVDGVQIQSFGTHDTLYGVSLCHIGVSSPALLIVWIVERSCVAIISIIVVTINYKWTFWTESNLNA